MLEDFRLRIFLTVAKERSFTKAAAALSISQPAVSQNVAELEKITGVKLFERLRGEVQITPEGEVFKRYVKSIISSYAEAARLFTFLEPADVSVSTSDEIESLFLAPALADFTKIHPEITFRRVSTQEEADIRIVLHPASSLPFELDYDAIAKVRISMSPTQKDMGDHKATHESLSYFNLQYLPSEHFAQTRLSALLKEFLSASIS